MAVPPLFSRNANPSCYRATSLHAYTPIGLHAKHPVGIQQDKGVPSMAPHRKAACYYLFYTRYRTT